MAKVSKAARARVKRQSMTEMKQLRKSARVLADLELISAKRYSAILRLIPRNLW